MIVDTHAHVYAATYLDYLEKIGVPASSVNIARNMRASNEDNEMSERLRQMDAAGVDIQILSSTPQSPDILHPANPETAADDAATAARMVNDIYAELIGKYEGRFLAYGAIPVNHPEKAVEEIAYCLDELGFVGIAINALFADPALSVGDETMHAIYSELDKRGSILYIHPTGNGAHSQPMQDHHLVWVNGAPVEDAVAALHLMKAGIPQKFPNMRIHVAHLGGDLPFISQRLEDNYTDWNSFPASPREMMKNMWFDAANFTPGALRLSAEVYNPEHLLMGSDYPYFQEDKYTRAVTYIPEAGLGDKFNEGVLWRNAVELVGQPLLDKAEQRKATQA